MSTPRRLQPDRSIRAATTTTQRGAFATWICGPYDASPLRGNAVLVPGFTGSKEDFGELLPLLADAGWRAATYDQRGQFETPAQADDDFSLAGFAADLTEVTCALFGADERVHLVGHSFGGLVAATAVVSDATPWASLTLMCSGPGAVVEPERQEALDGAELIEAEGLEAAYVSQAHRELEWGAEPPTTEIEEFLRRRFLANSPSGLAAVARLLATAPDRTEELAASNIPVSVLRGEHDDGWPHEVQEALGQALGTPVSVIAGAAHSPAVEAPGLTRDALVRFWTSADS